MIPKTKRTFDLCQWPERCQNDEFYIVNKQKSEYNKNIEQIRKTLNYSNKNQLQPHAVIFVRALSWPSSAFHWVTVSKARQKPHNKLYYPHDFCKKCVTATALNVAGNMNCNFFSFNDLPFNYLLWYNS